MTQSTLKQAINRSTLLIGALFFVLGFIACSNLLDVENPNNVLEENLNDPAAATAITNGVLSTGSRAISYCLAPYTTVTDEGGWIGSRDAWNQLDRGTVTDFNNEFIDAAWPFITEARYSADEAIERLSGFNSAGTLKDIKNLIKAYLYSAMIRATIADMFDDFVYSDKRTAGNPIGENNMARVYDEAIAHLDAALPLAQSSTATDFVELQRRILALRARIKHAKAVWGVVNPRPITPPANPYVNAGVDDATAALALMNPNYRWQLIYAPSGEFYNEWSFEVNSRRELSVVAPPKDIVDTNVDDPRIVAETADFKNNTKHGGDRYSPFTVVSEREMQLIIAEANLASGNAQAALDVLNAVRARDNLTAGTDAGPLLQHERRANLFMMGRRLSDMYRFGSQASNWVPSSDAITQPGSFFPITIQERRANPNVGG